MSTTTGPGRPVAAMWNAFLMADARSFTSLTSMLCFTIGRVMPTVSPSRQAVREWFRRQKVRSLWTTLLSSLTPNREDDDQDPLETLEPAYESNRQEAPGDRLEQSQILEIIEKEITKLPERQREAFIMRYWEELDVAETARRMRCSEGSVKTHCSRATHTLAAALKARGITL